MTQPGTSSPHVGPFPHFALLMQVLVVEAHHPHGPPIQIIRSEDFHMPANDTEMLVQSHTEGVLCTFSPLRKMQHALPFIFFWHHSLASLLPWTSLRDCCVLRRLGSLPSTNEAASYLYNPMFPPLWQGCMLGRQSRARGPGQTRPHSLSRMLAWT